jgi:hypothetical protein
MKEARCQELVSERKRPKQIASFQNLGNFIPGGKVKWNRSYINWGVVQKMIF